MKPNFALSLSFDGLRLMHRTQGGWHLVGQVAVDDPDMTGALARLQAAATTLEPNGLTTKLLIPNDQIKYLALDTTRAEDDDVREALHGATPYSVDQLTYDFAKGGGRTYVAAVARETLDEAEQFAIEHGFNPVSFAAVPEPFTYMGEAFFGAAASATSDQTAERDDEPVIVIGDADVELPPAAPPPDPDPMSMAKPMPTAKIEKPDHATPEPAVEETDVSKPDPRHAPEPDVVPDPVAEPDPIANIDPDASADEVARDVKVLTPQIQIVEDDTQPALNTKSVADPGPVPIAEQEPPVPVFSSRLRADRSNGRPPEKPAAPQKPRTAPRTEPSLSRAPEPAAPTLAAPTDRGTDAVPPLSPPRRAAGTSPASVPPPVEAPTSANVPRADVAPPITGEAATALPPKAAVAAASLAATPLDNTAPDRPAADSTQRNDAAKAAGGIFASRRMAKANAKESANQAAETEKASRGSVFGARKTAKPKVVVGGKPRFLGLILTAVLLLFLLAIAAFAAMAEDGIAGWFGFGNEETQIAAEPAETPPDLTQNVAATPEVATPAPAENVAAVPDASATPTPPPGGQILTPEDANRIYAATGVWQKAPRIPQIPRTSNLDALTLGAAPSAVPDTPASTAPPTANSTGDALIATPIDPPAPSETFNFGDDGLIVATEDGALSPDGTLIIAGRPSLEVPVRPGTVAPDVTPQDQLAAVIPDAAAPLADAPEGVIVIAGRPAIAPPVRTGTAPPAPAPEAAALATGEAPLAATDGLLVLAGTPPVLPPVRPGTTVSPEASGAPADVPDTAPNTDPNAAPLPEGLNVVTGAPPVLPPARPAPTGAQTDAALDTLSTDIATALSSGIAQTPSADTPRPLVRPAIIAQTAEAATAAAQSATLAATTPVLGTLTVAQAAAFRPLTRPAGLAPVAQPAAVAAPTPTEPSGLQIAPEIAAAVAAANSRPNPIVNPTALAVNVSRVPDLRPRNMARIVERATAANARAAQAAQQVAAAQVAPRAVAPSGPTGNAVAQNATLDNAINLRNVNLIGIYGGDSDRRALIRLGNGRYQRVTVGDRLDGGRVTAISAGALSYQKRGRSITLQVAG